MATVLGKTIAVSSVNAWLRPSDWGAKADAIVGGRGQYDCGWGDYHHGRVERPIQLNVSKLLLLGMGKLIQPAKKVPKNLVAQWPQFHQGVLIPLSQFTGTHSSPINALILTVDTLLG